MIVRIWWRLSVLGLIGATSVLLLIGPVEQLVPVKMNPLLLRLAAVGQPALLSLALSAVGAWAAPKLRLDAPAVRAWAEQRPILPELRRQFVPAAIGGIGAAAVLLVFGAIIRHIPEGAALQRFDVPLQTRVLYGGLVEEVLVRWGLMSLLAWLAWRLAGRPTTVPAWVYWTGIVLAALLFAAGHLPALAFLIPNPPTWLITLVLATNFIPGVIFGWLFWRRGLEAAMIAHALAHVFAWAALLVITG